MCLAEAFRIVLVVRSLHIMVSRREIERNLGVWLSSAIVVTVYFKVFVTRTYGYVGA